QHFTGGRAGRYRSGSVLRHHWLGYQRHAELWNGGGRDWNMDPSQSEQSGQPNRNRQQDWPPVSPEYRTNSEPDARQHDKRQRQRRNAGDPQEDGAPATYLKATNGQHQSRDRTDHAGLVVHATEPGNHAAPRKHLAVVLEK